MIKIEIEKLPLPRDAQAAKLQGVPLTEQRWSIHAVGPDGMNYMTTYGQEQSVPKNKLSPTELASAMARDLSLRRRAALLTTIDKLAEKYPGEL